MLSDGIIVNPRLDALVNDPELFTASRQALRRRYKCGTELVREARRAAQPSVGELLKRWA